MSNKESNTSVFIIKTFLCEFIFIPLWFWFTNLLRNIGMYLSFTVTAQCALSVSLIFVLVLGMKYSLMHDKPECTKKSLTIKHSIGWILVILSIIGAIISILNFIGNYNMVQSVISSNANQSSFYSNQYDWLYLDFAGRDIIFTGLLFAWGYYLVKCGPLYSPIWKRTLKTLIYIVVTYILLDNTLYNPNIGWIGLLIVFVLMIIIVAISKDYIEQPVSEIIEDVEINP